MDILVNNDDRFYTTIGKFRLRFMDNELTYRMFKDFIYLHFSVKQFNVPFEKGSAAKLLKTSSIKRNRKLVVFVGCF